MELIIEVPIAAIALVLSVLSYKTLRRIKYLGVGKSFWIPVLLSGIFFLIGSVIAILFDLGVSFEYIVEVSDVSRLIALCILLGGVSTYSRKITSNLGEKFLLPAEGVNTEKFEDNEVSESVLDRLEEKEVKKEVECKHSFGYLQTLPKNNSIPDECLGCDKIIECKHSHFEK